MEDHFSKKFSEKTKNIALDNMIARSGALVADFGCGTELVQGVITEVENYSSATREELCFKMK